jgi:membrane-associated protease RseP (regulator of RpoE activity)
LSYTHDAELSEAVARFSVGFAGAFVRSTDAVGASSSGAFLPCGGSVTLAGFEAWAGVGAGGSFRNGGKVRPRG